MYHQIPLNIGVSETVSSIASFVVDACNSVPFNFIKKIVKQDDYSTSKFIYLLGEHNSGKTHLLQAAVNEAEKHAFRSIYFDVSQYNDVEPGYLLQGIEDLDLICIDNIGAVAGNPSWEAEIFYLYNRWLNKQHGAFIVSSQLEVGELPFKKPDLITRLSSGYTLTMKMLPRIKFTEVLMKREEIRGGLLPLKRAETIVKSFEDLEDCVAVLDAYDVAVLEGKKKFSENILGAVISSYKKSQTNR
ncbi:MAG: DnaA ATPase domain-containing protein [Succinivibrionaceae bacterium]